jgi:hypothetical protein
MNLPFVIAGVLALVGAAIHGGAGEALIVAKLRTEELAPTPFGGPSMTKLMIRVTWHIVTIAFVVIGSGLAACAPAVSSETCRGVGRVAAISFTGFAALAVGLATAGLGARRVPRALMRHPGPLVFVVVAALAWWGQASY